MNDGRYTVEMLNQAFFEAQELISPAITQRARLMPSLFRGMISKGTFEYGQGYTGKTRQFHAGTALQDESRKWSEVQPSRPPNPSTGDPGYDACRYNAPVVGYGFTERSYKLYEAFRRSTDICLRDLLYKWQFANQFKLIVSSFGDITIQEWENFLRETYVSFSTKMLAMPGMPEIAIADGADTVDLAGVDLGNIGMLNQALLDKLYLYLYRQSFGGAIGTVGGMPQFGLITSAETSQEVPILGEQAREAWLYAKPDVLLENIGSFKSHKGFAHVIDPMTIRYKIDPTNPSTLVRVWPYKASPATIGEAMAIDPEYVNAPFELSIVFLKNVFQYRVPPANPGNVAGATFNVNDYMGEFKWINIPDRQENLLGEKGFYFARMAAAPEPLEYNGDAVAVLHRRSTAVETIYANTGTNRSGSAQNILTVANGSTAASNKDIIVTLAASLTAEIGDAVTVAYNDGSPKTVAGVIVDDSGDATYRITLASATATAGGWAAVLTAATTHTVVTA